MKAQTKTYKRDDKDNREDVLKSAWRKSGKLVSLKAYAREHKAEPAAAMWLHNKRVNTKADLKRIGRTNRTSGKK